MDRTQPINTNDNRTQLIQPHGAPTETGQFVTRKRVSLSGEVVEDEVTVQTTPAAQPYYTRKPLAPPGTFPVTALDPAAVNMHANARSFAPVGERLEKALAIIAPLLLIATIVAHYVPNIIALLGYLLIFLTPLILGACSAVPQYGDDGADCFIVLLLSWLFGPAIAIAIYGVVALVRQEGNAALFAILGSVIIITGTLQLAVIHQTNRVEVFMQIAVLGWLNFFAVCIGFAGWILSSFFKTGMEDF